MAYNTPTGLPPTNLQDQLDAWNSDLTSGDSSLNGANQAAAGLAKLGSGVPSGSMFSTPNSNGGLSTQAYTPPSSSNSPLTSALTGATPQSRLAVGGTQRTASDNTLAAPFPNSSATNPLSVGQFNATNYASNPLQIQGPDGQTQTFNQINDSLNQTLQPYIGKTININGTPMQVTQRNGGYLLNGQPLNVVMGMGLLPGQTQALVNDNPVGAPYTQAPVVNAGGNPTTSNLGTGTPQPNTGANALGGNPVTQTSNISDLLQQLMNLSLGQGASAQSQLGPNSNLSGDMNSFLQQVMGLAQTSSNTRDSLVNSMTNQAGNISNQMLGQIMPSLSGAMANYNTGLDPSALAALQSQAIDMPQQQYEQGMSALQTSLQQRGMGGGQMPGSIGDLVRGYGPLIAARGAQTEQGLQNAALQNQNALNQNRQLALSAANTGAGLTTGLGNMYGNLATGLGNVYNPASELSSTGNTLNSLLGLGEGAVNAGFQGTSQANQLGETLSNNAPGSLSRLLLSSLLSTIAAPGTTNSGGSILGSILGAIFGNKTGFAGANPNGTTTAGGNWWDDPSVLASLGLGT